jgi:hypothetical protein
MQSVDASSFGNDKAYLTYGKCGIRLQQGIDHMQTPRTGQDRRVPANAASTLMRAGRKDRNQTAAHAGPGDCVLRHGLTDLVRVLGDLAISRGHWRHMH